MPIVNRMMGSGLSALAANNIAGDNSAALTATGTTKATALVLSSQSNYVSICSSGTGVSLPAMNQGDDVEIANNGANNLLVYTTKGVGDTITNLSANGGFTLSVQKTASFLKMTSSVVMVNKSA